MAKSCVFHRLPPRCNAIYIMFLLMVFLSVHSASAAHRSTRRTVSSSGGDYDRIISSFSPDGRLEQVEYSAQSATRTIVAAKSKHNRIIVVAPTGSRIEPILLPMRESSLDTAVSSESPHKNGSGSLSSYNNPAFCWMIGTGIAGDVLWLRDVLRQQAIDSTVVWEDDDHIMVERWVQDVARICHRLTFEAGARPLGAAAIVMAWGDKNTEEEAKLLEVSGWNGCTRHLEFACLGPHQDSLRSLLQRRNTVDSDVQLSKTVQGLVDAVQQVLGTKESLDVWILSVGGEMRQYTNIRGRKSRRRLEEWIVDSYETKEGDASS